KIIMINPTQLFSKKFVTYKKNISEIDAIAFEIKNLKAAIVSTDTVAGIISLNKNLIYKIKKRSFTKKIIKFISNVNQIPEANEIVKKIAKNFWPGKLTIVFNKESYRIPNDNFLIKLIERTGPLYSSSANISGLEPINNELEAFKYFQKNKNDIIFIEGNYYLNNSPSTVFDIDNNMIVRQGDISYESIAQYIKES
ncbi:MAG: Sua5/YciO/YrdC/YwlC family protein, partial [Malacoplasma sp.]|nr:Sua5/YciO/YrdC/YwlC family protein [Malacoplasma sp.]